MKTKFKLIIIAAISLLVILILFLILFKKSTSVNYAVEDISTETEQGIEETSVISSEATGETSGEYTQTAESIKSENTDEITGTSATESGIEAKENTDAVAETETPMEQDTDEDHQPLFETDETNSNTTYEFLDPWEGEEG